MQRTIYLLAIAVCFAGSSFQAPHKSKYHIPAEFEQQECIWVSWVETGFLSGDPFCNTILDAIEAMYPYVKVKIFYGPQLNDDKSSLQSKIYTALLQRHIDTSRVSLFYNEKAFGAIQDPGPVFLKNEKGEMAVADFRYAHPDKRSEEIDRNVATQMHLPIISSTMFSEGGAWQTNGKGTMLLVESVELDRNKNMDKLQIEAEYKRVLGVTKIIWLKNGMKEEEWGKFTNGKYGIGTGGHIDEFCRFVNDSTVLLAAISEADTVGNEILTESFFRMQANENILKHSTTADGKHFNIIRLPAGPLMTKKLLYKNLDNKEKHWFDQVTTDSVEFYLTTGYMNFIIANTAVVTSGYWKEGLPLALKQQDEEAKRILQQAFPGRKITQINCTPLHHDGAGLHCHSRNQPA